MTLNRRSRLLLPVIDKWHYILSEKISGLSRDFVLTVSQLLHAVVKLCMTVSSLSRKVPTTYLLRFDECLYLQCGGIGLVFGFRFKKNDV